MMIILPLTVLIVFLLMMSGFFSGSEIAFAKCRKQRLRKLSDEGNKRAEAAYRISENFTETLSAILAGNELVNIAASSAATVLAITVFSENPVKAQSIASAVLTVVLLIFGEIVPKIIFSRRADSMVMTAAGPILVLTRILRPFLSVVNKLVIWMSPLWTPKKRSVPAYTSEELVVMIDDYEKDGGEYQENVGLIRRTIKFGSRDFKIRDIMTSRVNVVAFCLEDGLETLENDSGLLGIYSNIPVYRESLDDIVGILPTREYKKKTIKKDDDHSISYEEFADLLIKPIYVYEQRPVFEIYKVMKKQSSAMAIVLDEFGGMIGVVTTEDIYRWIFGAVYDDKNSDDKTNVLRYTETNESIICIVRGEMLFEELFEQIRNKYNYKIHQTESSQSTVGGWATGLFGHVPENGETADEYGIKITVLKTSDKKIEILKLEITPDKDTLL